MWYKVVKKIVIILLIGLNHTVLSIKCFQCFLAEHPYYLNPFLRVKTCKNFDYSDAYITDCPSSTFCYKKTVRDYFYNTEYVREERGCAQQVYRGQKYEADLGWGEDSYVVNNAYKNGCKLAESHGLKSLGVEECYCNDSDLCNSAKKASFRILGLICVLLIYFIK